MTKFVEGNNLYEADVGWEGLSEEDERIDGDILDQVSEEYVFEKEGYNAMKSDSLEEVILSNDLERVYVAGFETSSCVLATAFGLFDMEVSPIVVESCCASHTVAAHHSALSILRRNIDPDNIVDHSELDF